MAVTVTPIRSSVSVKLDGGQSGEKQITLSMSLGTISANAENEKIMNVVTLLGPCLTKQIKTTQRTDVTELKA